MARIRSIKPEIFQSSEVMDCTPVVRLLFIGCITQADDEGRGRVDPRKFKGCVFPGDDEITVANVRSMFDDLSTNRLIWLYLDSNQTLTYQLRRWKEHQKIDKPKKSSIESPPQREPSSNDHRIVADHSSGIEGSEGSDGSEGSKDLGAVDNGDKSATAEGAPARAIGPRPAGANENRHLGNGVQTPARRRAELAAQGITADEIKRLVPDAETDGDLHGVERRGATA